MQKWRQLLNVFLKNIWLLLALVLFVVAYQYRKIDSYWIDGVEFFEPNLALSMDKKTNDKDLEIIHHNKNSPTPFFVSNYHWLTEGKAQIIILREFYNVPFLKNDKFLKITLRFRDGIKKGRHRINGDNVKGFYTKGESSLAATQCGTEIKGGYIDIKELRDKKYSAIISFKIKCINPIRDLAQDIKYRERFVFTKLDKKDLTPWLGQKNDQLFKETFRNY